MCSKGVPYVSHIPPFKKTTRAKARISGQNENGRRTASVFPAPRERKKETRRKLMKNTLRLREKHDFEHLFSRGRRFSSSFFVFTAARNSIGHTRCAVLAAKKNEKHAVARNRVRRRIREWLRKSEFPYHYSIDLAINVKKEAYSASKKAFYEDLRAAVEKLKESGF